MTHFIISYHILFVYSSLVGWSILINLVVTFLIPLPSFSLLHLTNIYFKLHNLQLVFVLGQLIAALPGVSRKYGVALPESHTKSTVESLSHFPHYSKIKASQIIARVFFSQRSWQPSAQLRFAALSVRCYAPQVYNSGGRGLCEGTDQVLTLW